MTYSYSQIKWATDLTFYGIFRYLDKSGFDMRDRLSFNAVSVRLMVVLDPEKFVTQHV